MINVDVGLSDISVALTPEARKTKTKINKWDLFKKLHSERNHHQNKQETYRMGKDFANHISNKGLKFKKHKERIQHITTTTKNNPIKNGQRC